MSLSRWAVDGCTLNVDIAGGTGQPVLFQHGLCGDARQTAESFPPGLPFRRVTVECRGHGASEVGPLDALSLQTFAGDLISYLEHEMPCPVVLGGISMGAALSLQIAVRRPDLVAALVLARPAWTIVPAPPNMAPNALAGSLLAHYPAEQARQLFEQSAIAQTLAQEAPDNLASLRGFFDRAPQHATAALLSAISADTPGVSWEAIERIAVPALVIGHQRDAVHPLAMAEELAQHLPAATLVQITPKAVDRSRYVADFQAAFAEFLTGL